MYKDNKDWRDLVPDPVKIPGEDVPDIELYMDQLTTFMNTRLESTKRYPEDKILTKTMINNYTKNHLLPPSVKKRYSKEHLFMLIFIYHLKNTLSISDIQVLLEMVSSSFFPMDEESGLTLKEIYERTVTMCADRHEDIEEEIDRVYEMTRNSFSDYSLSEDRSEYLEFFTVIYQLCYDIYVRKQLIERLIDSYRDSHPFDKDKGRGRKKRD